MFMNHNEIDPVDAWLRQQFEGSVPDGGFCERVMQRLPERRRRVIWPLVAGILIGVAMCWLSLLPVPMLHSAWQDWMRGELSGSALGLLSIISGMSFLALGWSLTEARDG
jgi:hypothetical protein